jgi:hypothetical protein
MSSLCNGCGAPRSPCPSLPALRCGSRRPETDQPPGGQTAPATIHYNAEFQSTSANHHEVRPPYLAGASGMHGYDGRQMMTSMLLFQGVEKARLWRSWDDPSGACSGTPSTFSTATARDRSHGMADAGQPWVAASRAIPVVEAPTVSLIMLVPGASRDRLASWYVNDMVNVTGGNVDVPRTVAKTVRQPGECVGGVQPV